MNCTVSNQLNNNMTTELYNNMMAQIEDLTDYQFIQSVIQEVTSSCALPLPLPANAIPPLIIQAAKYFWLNCDYSIEERYWVVNNAEIQRCGLNRQVKLPEQIISVWGCHKANNSFRYGAMGDFSLERMVLNNSLMTSGIGASLKNTLGGEGTGFSMMDITAALYEVQTWLAMFDVPLTYNFNEFSHILFIGGDLGYSDLVLSVYQRVKLLDLYNNLYFFRYVVCLVKRSLTQIMGTYEFKMPGGTVVNYQQFRDNANEEILEIKEWINNNHTPDYFLNTNTI